jgi:hypothetical protein
VDENIVQMHAGSESEVNLSGVGLIVQQNGIYFVHVLNDESWQSVYNSACAAYQRDKNGLVANESALSKHVWFEGYLSSFLPAGRTFEQYIERASPY